MTLKFWRTCRKQKEPNGETLESGRVSNAFTFLMSKKKPVNKEESEEDDVVELETVPVVDLGDDLEGKVVEKVPIVKKNLEVKNNVFLTLMKNSRKSFEPPPEEEKKEPNHSDEMVDPESKASNVPADEKLKNMLSVL